MSPTRNMFPFRSQRGGATDEESSGKAPPYLKLDIDANHNQRVVFQEIRTHKRVTRSELATITGLTKPTIVNVRK